MLCTVSALLLLSLNKLLLSLSFAEYSLPLSFTAQGIVDILLSDKEVSFIIKFEDDDEV
jgi:hypothetical protein